MTVMIGHRISTTRIAQQIAEALENHIAHGSTAI